MPDLERIDVDDAGLSDETAKRFDTQQMTRRSHTSSLTTDKEKADPGMGILFESRFKVYCHMNDGGNAFRDEMLTLSAREDAKIM